MCNKTIAFRAASRRGKRSVNQDNLRIGNSASFAVLNRNFFRRGKLDVSRPQLICVCDGAGGEAMGEKASLRALYGIKEYLAEALPDEPLETWVRSAAQAAQERVLELYEQVQMIGGSTLAMVAIRGREYVILNIGDSPVFHYSRSRDSLTELSQRHNLEWFKRRRGITPAPGDGARLVRCLGQRDLNTDAVAHVVHGELESGDALLLCSDGVSEAFTEKRLKCAMKWRMGVRFLTWFAAMQPDSDNCTAIRLDV